MQSASRPDMFMVALIGCAGGEASQRRRLTKVPDGCAYTTTLRVERSKRRQRFAREWAALRRRAWHLQDLLQPSVLRAPGVWFCWMACWHKGTSWPDVGGRVGEAHSCSTCTCAHAGFKINCNPKKKIYKHARSLLRGSNKREFTRSKVRIFLKPIFVRKKLVVLFGIK